LSRIGEVAKPLAPKLEMISQLTDKFLLEKRGPLAGNAMLAGDPGCGGLLAQKMGADAQEDNIGTHSALAGPAPAPRDPLAYPSKPVTRQNQHQGMIAFRTVGAVDRVCGIIKAGIRRQMAGHNHRATPFRTICRKR
jgi:hypothetical protein